MTLSDLASLGSFVSGVAVLASLVFLFFQMRQMTEQVRQTERNQRAIIHQGRIAQSTDRLLHLAEPAFARAWLRSAYCKEPAQEEIDFLQFLGYEAALMREAQDLYYQRDLGLLDDTTVQNQLAGLRATLVAPGGKAYWRATKGTFDPRFVERIDALDGSIAVRTEFAEYERHKAELAQVGQRPDVQINRDV
jgi:hypothetical protein